MLWKASEMVTLSNACIEDASNSQGFPEQMKGLIIKLCLSLNH